MMDTSKIEDLGVDAVKHYINGIACARPFMNTNDKTPLWDGSIFVYKTEQFENKNLDFTVSIQIKASDYSKKDIPDNANYQVKLDDLAQYEKNGGLVFFFVALDNKQIGHIFYAALTKTRIKRLISTAKGKKGRCISLKPIPHDTDEFLNEIHKIALQCEYPVINLPQLVGKKGLRYEITAERVPQGTSFLDYIATHPVNLLVSKEGDDQKYYVDGFSSIHLRKFFSEPIYVGNKKYFDGYYSTSTTEGRKIEIGNCLQLFVPYKVINSSEYDSNDKINMRINIHPMDIDSAIKQITFIYEALSAGEIIINNEPYNLRPLNNENLEAFINSCKHWVKFWSDAKEVFDLLHVDYSDFVPSNISNIDINNINVLIKAFIKKGPVYDNVDYDHIVLLNIGNLNVLVGAKHKEGKEFTLFDIYDESVTASANYNGQRYQVPVYSALIADYDPLPSNLYLEGMIGAYEKLIPVNPEIISRANNDGLCLIGQYDKTGKKKLLFAAKSLFEWMLRHEQNGREEIILHRINFLQVKKRLEGTLSEKEKNFIMNTMTSTLDNSIKFACSVLLEEYTSASFYAKKLTPKRIENIKQYPIYTLYERRGNK